MKHTKVTVEQDSQIIALFQDGLGKRKIGTQLNLDEEIVGGRLRSLGLRRPRTSVQMPTDDELRNLYINQGLSSGEIAGQLGVHAVSIQKRLRKAGIPRRGRGRETLPSKEELLAVWTDQCTEAQVQTQLGIGHGTLHRLREKYALPPKPRRDMSGENSPVWTGGCADWYGKNWEQQRNATRHRDKYLCRRCGVTEMEMGRQCDVHHLKPFRTFNNNYEKANTLPNLITLCPDCHTYMERNLTEPIPSEPDPSLRTFQCLKTKRLRSYRVNPSEVAEVYKAGEKLTDMMKQFNATASEIYRALRRAGVSPVRKNDVDWNEVRRLAAEGLDKQQIAEKLGCSLLHLYRILPAEQPFCERPEVVTQILELGRQGLGTRAIAKQTGAGRTQVKALLRSNGIGPAPQPRPAGGRFAKPTIPPTPDLQPCACGCGDTVDVSVRKGARKLGPHFIRGHHRRGAKLNANQLAAVSAHTFKPMDPAITAKIRSLLGTMPQRQIAATLGVSQGYVSKIAASCKN